MRATIPAPMNSRVERSPNPRALLPPLALAGGARQVVDAAGSLLFSGESATATHVAGATFVLTGDAAGSADGWLFWPPRPAALIAWHDGGPWRALDGDAVLVTAGRALVVDPVSGAAVAVEHDDDGPLELASAVGVDPLRLRATKSARVTLLAEVGSAAAWLRTATATAAAAELERRIAAAVRLGLAVENVAPGHVVVRWRADAAASAEEQEELAKVAASRHSGTWVWLAGPAATELPAALHRLVGEGPPVASAGWRVWAPVGRGRVAQRLSAGDAVATAPTADERRGVAQQAEAWLAAHAEQATAAAGRTLRVAVVADGEKFRHEADGGERVVVATGGAEAVPTIGKRVATREAFTVTADDWPAGPRSQLVLERTTCREDCGALLRLELDDEDLGPWRLGSGGSSSGVQLDYFAIPADLLAGRERCRITAHYVTAGDHVALRWRFLAEEEPAGSWLTDLEIAPAVVRAEACRRVDNASGRIGRRWSLAPGVTQFVTVPRGYARLVGRVAASAEAGSAGATGGLQLEIRPQADPRGATLGESSPPDGITATVRPGDVLDLALPTAPVELRLTGCGPFPITLVDPQLLRR